MHRYNFSFLLAVAVFMTGCQDKPETYEPRRLEVLFLGHDSEHHNSSEFLPYLAASLTPRGINFTYTDQLSDLNQSYLAKFDALSIYANHDEIKPSQEKALIDFVRKGGGLIPIHSASYCFRNSEKYINLVGAQFASHDTGTFSLVHTIPDHVASSDLLPFETWDETYVHTLHSDKLVLMERVEGDHREPYTWVKEYGKGRMYYTALGHDLRTWSHPGFHEMLYRGILWACGPQKAGALDSLHFPKLSYSPAKIANYEKRDPPPQLQAPLSPEESMQLIQVPVDFELQLFASEPDIVNPIAMVWDEKGRLFVAETVDYPNEINVEDGVGNDRIKILEDTDGDGRADRITVFADRLSVPTSMVVSNGGLIVSQAPYFLFLQDTNGDDKADVREVIMEGWGTFDTHAGPSNLRYGFDNQIWGTVGYSGFEATIGGEDHDFGQAIFRFEPDGSKLELMSRTSNNTWGLGFSEENNVFVSTANNTHSGYYGIPDAHIRGVKGINLRGVQKIDGHYAFHPITRNFRQVDVFGGFTSAAGHAIYTARSYPSEYWNRMAFVSEPTGHLLHRAILQADGAGFQEKDGWNLMAGSDEWFSPVAAEVGPDGAVWILDWYNFIIQHNPTPPGFENGLGNAHINPLRDRQRGRIYRLSYREAPAYRPMELAPDDAETLVANLSNENLLWRMHAQRLLVEKRHTSAVPELLDLIKNENTDALGLNNAALHAIWTLDGLDMVKKSNEKVYPAILRALKHPAAGVRKAAVQVLPKDDQTLAHILESRILYDSDAHTRLAAIHELWSLPSTGEMAEILIELAKDESIVGDLWLKRAVYLVCVRHKEEFIKTLLAQDPDVLEKASRVISSQEVDYKDPNLDLSSWNDIPVPRWLNHTNIEELTGFSGVLWYRTNFELPGNLDGASGRFHMAGAANRDITYINGNKIGEGSGWDRERNYGVQRGVLKAGINHIAIRLQAGGGIGYGDPDDLYIMAGTTKVPLAGTWKYKIEQLITSQKSEYADGEDIFSNFLKHYGPDAKKISEEIQKTAAIVDKIFLVRTIKDQMKYDVTLLEADAGDMVEIVFQNNDGMQHNLLVVARNALRKVGMAAEAMAKEADAMENGYVPDLPEIMYFTPLLDPGEEFRLKFQVPDEAGDYPFVCTFPGHWQTMNGILRVKREAG